jgi:hypothetical protein
MLFLIWLVGTLIFSIILLYILFALKTFFGQYEINAISYSKLRLLIFVPIFASLWPIYLLCYIFNKLFGLLISKD